MSLINDRKCRQSSYSVLYMRWQAQTNFTSSTKRWTCHLMGSVELCQTVSILIVFFIWIKRAYFWDMNSVTCESLLIVPVMLQLKMQQHCKKVSVLADCLHRSDDGFAVSNGALHQTSVTTWVQTLGDYHMKNIISLLYCFNSCTSLHFNP